MIDIVAMLNYIFAISPAFDCIPEAGDGNLDGSLTVLDVVGFIQLVTAQVSKAIAYSNWSFTARYSFARTKYIKVLRMLLSVQFRVVQLVL